MNNNRVACAINDYALFGIEPGGLTKKENAVFITTKSAIQTDREEKKWEVTHKV
jgi:hypothetical protein